MIAIVVLAGGGFQFSKEEKAVTRHPCTVVALVHKDNPVDSFTFDQLKGVVLGKIACWSELGGPVGLPIGFYAREGNLSGVGHLVRIADLL